jgi:hypothetical protein
VFYAADAGIGIGAARVLVSGDYHYDLEDATNNSYILNDGPGAAFAPLVRSQVSVGPLIPSQISPCSLCEINNAGSYRESSYQRGSILLPSRGQRETLAEALAERRIAAAVDIQPWRVPASSLLPIELMDPAVLAERASL